MSITRSPLVVETGGAPPNDLKTGDVQKSRYLDWFVTVRLEDLLLVGGKNDGSRFVGNAGDGVPDYLASLSKQSGERCQKSSGPDL